MKCKIIDNEVYEHQILYRSRSLVYEIFHVSEPKERIEQIKENNKLTAIEDFFKNQPELAQFVMDHAIDTRWDMIKNKSGYTVKYVLTGYLRPKDYTFMMLKFGDKHFKVDKYLYGQYT